MPGITTVAGGVGVTAALGTALRYNIRRSNLAYENRKRGLQSDITLPHEGPVELYHNSDSFCSQVARACLYEAEIEWTSHHIELHPRGQNLDIQLKNGYQLQNLTDEFLAVNPWGTVPVLVHDGHPVWESHDITNYIAHQLPGGERLLPKEQAQRELMEMWMHEAHFGADEKGRRLAGNCIPMFTVPHFGKQALHNSLRTSLYTLWKHPIRMRGYMMFALWVLNNISPRNIPVSAGCIKVTTDAFNRMDKQLAAQSAGTYLAGTNHITLADISWMPVWDRLLSVNQQHLFEQFDSLREYVALVRTSRGYVLGVKGMATLSIDSGLQSRGDVWRDPDWVRERHATYQHIRSQL